MRILILYDGSQRAQAALTDLENAGLPRVLQARLVSLVEPLPPTSRVERAWHAVAEAGSVELMTQQAEWTVRQGKRRLQSIFPQWQFETKICHGSDLAPVIAHAVTWKPELLIISPGAPKYFERFFKSGLTNHLIENAPCSVRVARGERAPLAGNGLRLLIGYDGSPSASAAVHEVCSRQWPLNTEVRVVAALEPSLLTSHSRKATEWREIQQSLRQASQFLREAGLHVSSVWRAGQPKPVLLEEAEKWNAHCMFVGHSRRGVLSRFFPGSTSAALASQAPCSVEVVREEKLQWVMASACATGASLRPYSMEAVQ